MVVAHLWRDLYQANLIEQTQILQPYCYECLPKLNICNCLYLVVHRELKLLHDKVIDELVPLQMVEWLQL